MNSLKEVETIFKALSDKSRIRIVKMLQHKPLCVCEIREILNLATSTVSNHLSILRDAGLITDWKDGKWINYKINSNPKSPIVSNALLFVQLQLEEDETIKKDRKQGICVDRNVLCCK
ncbi:MAG: metalloregulator ArsR/SmtB family transcription factor [Ignavibacteriae bacterium]|nr:metalloregulator ArsR/SmtB family transcription factor [Ignavibacteriota bacterium]